MAQADLGWWRPPSGWQDDRGDAYVRAAWLYLCRGRGCAKEVEAKVPLGYGGYSRGYPMHVEVVPGVVLGPRLGLVLKGVLALSCSYRSLRSILWRTALRMRWRGVLGVVWASCGIIRCMDPVSCLVDLV